jgi:hypothetical protein
MRIIAAFPGTGRREFIAQYPNIGFINPPLYPWDRYKRRSEELLTNTLSYQRARGSYCLVTPHIRTLAYLDKSQQEYLLVLPDVSLNMAYQARYLAAPPPEGGMQFAAYMLLRWTYWLQEIQAKAHPRRQITLEGDDTLLTRLDFHQNPDYFPGYQQIGNTDPCSTG